MPTGTFGIGQKFGCLNRHKFPFKTAPIFRRTIYLSNWAKISDKVGQGETGVGINAANCVKMPLGVAK